MKLEMSISDYSKELNQKWILVPRYPRRANPSIKQLLTLIRPERMFSQRLVPRARDAARSNSLSSRYGLDRFPFHTDFASVDAPPRFIILVAPRPRRAKTLLFDANELIEKFGHEHLYRCVFLQSTRKSRYRRLLTQLEGKLRFRYNADVMTPYNSEAREVEDYIQNEMSRVISIDWGEHRMALIDNWNVFHAREACIASDNVSLFRFAIWGDFYGLDY